MVEGLASLHWRAMATRALLAWRAELVGALGGEDPVTPPYCFGLFTSICTDPCSDAALGRRLIGRNGDSGPARFGHMIILERAVQDRDVSERVARAVQRIEEC